MIIYTCITNKKDAELPHIPIFKGIKYVCYTEHPFNDKTWEFRPLWYINEDARRTARWHKANSHLLFPMEDYVLWVDGNIETSTNPFKLVEALGKTNNFLLTTLHPSRNCVFQEFEAVKRLRYDDEEVLKKQRNKYESEGMPKGLGLPETCVLLRKHNQNCVKFNEDWWKEIRDHSKRDQLSFSYVMWKNKFDYSMFINKTFKRRPHSVVTTKES